MRLQELLNKFTNSDFLLTVDGWCEDLPFSQYEEEKTEDYWKKYKDRKIMGLAILMTNEKPELCIRLEEE